MHGDLEAIRGPVPQSCREGLDRLPDAWCPQRREAWARPSEFPARAAVEGSHGAAGAGHGPGAGEPGSRAIAAALIPAEISSSDEATWAACCRQVTTLLLGSNPLYLG